MADIIQHRRDTLDNWVAANPILADGEMGIVTNDPNKYKIGDGVHGWNELKFRGFDGTLVQEINDSETAAPSSKAVKNIQDCIKTIKSYYNLIEDSSLEEISSTNCVIEGNTENGVLAKVNGEIQNIDGFYTTPYLKSDIDGIKDVIIYLPKFFDINQRYYTQIAFYDLNKKHILSTFVFDDSILTLPRQLYVRISYQNDSNKPKVLIQKSTDITLNKAIKNLSNQQIINNNVSEFIKSVRNPLIATEDSSLEEIASNVCALDGNFEEGILVINTGAILKIDGFYTTPYLTTAANAIGNTVIFIPKFLDIDYNRFIQIAFYDSDKNFIGTSTILDETCIILPKNLYVRISYQNDSNKPKVLIKGISLNKKVSNLSDNSILSKIINGGSNLFIKKVDENKVTNLDELNFIDKLVYNIENAEKSVDGFFSIELKYIDNATGYTYYQVNFPSLVKGFANIVLVDKESGSVIENDVLFGEKIIRIGVFDKYAVRITLANNQKLNIYRGIPSYIIDNVLKNENLNTKKVLWLGTSIPEGCPYPKNACENLGRSVINKALGSSNMAVYEKERTEYNWAMGLALAETVEEKRQRYKKFPEVTDDVFNSNLFAGASYENRVMPYLEEVDTVVFDHGYNDRGIIERDFNAINNDISQINWESRDTSTFIGAFNFLLDEIYKVKKDMRIIMATHFANNEIRNCQIVVKMQTLIAEHYGFPLIEVWKEFPATSFHIPNSSNYIAEFNTKYGTSWPTDRWNTDSNGNICYYQFLCPDQVHPHTDKTGNSERLLTKIFTKGLRDLI